MAKVRRKAVNCRLLEKSRYSKGYYKYKVTIKEKDGTIHEQPAYGKDMQDALSRLIKNEITVKVENKLTNNIGYFFIAWLFIMGWPAIFRLEHSPWFLVYSVGSIMTLFVLAGLWYNHVKKN